ncbi:MAG: glycosyltransferase family 4 protein [Candidatus Cloacimonetes bacterium]|jgi:glycosyltransferase involved in cell wall biosynthesis|nr:glycosyltransferase family 4 protein [Candidatus Cloacimonadota bacterium]
MPETVKKIALLGPAPPFRGGISQFALMLGREFSRTGHEVKMYTFKRQYPKLLFPGGEQTISFSGLEGISVQRVFTPYLPQSWRYAVSEIRVWKPDLLIVSYFLPWFAPSYTWILKKLADIRIVCLAHNIDFHEKWPGADLLSKRLFARCHSIVLLSEACKRDLQRKMPKHIADKGISGFHPIYDCYADNHASREKPSQPTALFFGLIKPYKGLDVLLAATKQALKAMPDLKLIIAGEVYGSSEQYLQMIRRLGLTEVVETHFRYIGEDEIGQLFQRSQVCVLPYKSATQSGVISTSYNFNVPVIASDVGGLSEYISPGETGLLVPPGNPEALAQAMIRYFKDGMYLSMSSNIPAYKEQYSWQKLADIFLQA